MAVRRLDVLPTRRRQQAVEISSATLMTVDVAVDGLVAEGAIDLGFKLQASGDLLRRPAGLELADDMIMQTCVAVQLAQPPVALVGESCAVAGK